MCTKPNRDEADMAQCGESDEQIDTDGTMGIERKGADQDRQPELGHGHSRASKGGGHDRAAYTCR